MHKFDTSTLCVAEVLSRCDKGAVADWPALQLQRHRGPRHVISTWKPSRRLLMGGTHSHCSPTCSRSDAHMNTYKTAIVIMLCIHNLTQTQLGQSVLFFFVFVFNCSNEFFTFFGWKYHVVLCVCVCVIGGKKIKTFTQHDVSTVVCIYYKIKSRRWPFKHRSKQSAKWPMFANLFLSLCIWIISTSKHIFTYTQQMYEKLVFNSEFGKIVCSSHFFSWEKKKWVGSGNKKMLQKNNFSKKYDIEDFLKRAYKWGGTCGTCVFNVNGPRSGPDIFLDFVCACFCRWAEFMSGCW